MEKSKFCTATWFSGFFGLGAVVHLMRLIGRFDVAIGGIEIPMVTSAVLVVVLGALSAGLLWMSLKAPCGEGKSSGSCCGH